MNSFTKAEQLNLLGGAYDAENYIEKEDTKYRSLGKK
jgi:hypothetical protein